MRRFGLLTLLGTVLACGGSEPLLSGETDGPEPEVGRSEWELPPVTRIDIVLIVDDSASMAGEQATLAANLSSFVEILDSPELRLDYRLAVLGTSGSNCGVIPGQPVDTSCRARLDDFDIPAGREAPAASLRDVCENNCLHDQVVAPLPWLQSVTEGYWQPSVPVPNGEALACWGLTGVGGCDHESPFENLLAFLASSENTVSPNFGFLRDDAYLYVVFIGDEDDCSARDPSIFDPNGERVFWPDGLDGDRPPSSVCFRAGASCEDLGEAWDCSPVDRGADGAPTSVPEEAVLEPLNHVLERLSQINQSKPIDPINGSSWVFAANIAAIGASGATLWPKSGPPGFVEEFGAGPGCEVGGAAGMAPTRLHELVEQLSAGNQSSTCNEDYTVAFDVLASAGPDQLRPFCFGDCAELQDQRPTCVISLEWTSQNSELSITECLRDEDAYALDPATGGYLIPDGEDLCVAYLTDSSGTTLSPTDDLSQECQDDGARLEFAIARRAGDSRVLEGRYVARCLLDPEPGACASD